MTEVKLNHICRVCKVELTPQNIMPSHIKYRDWICNSCRSINEKSRRIKYRQQPVEGTHMCRICGVELTTQNTTPPNFIYRNWICRKCFNQNRKRYPQNRSIEAKERHRKSMKEYNQRPEIKERLREYQRRYIQKPDVKKRLSRSQKSGRIAITDCLNKDVPVSFADIIARSGAGRSYAHMVLNSLVKIGLVKHIEPDSYCIVPDNPLRYALDGYYREKTRSE